MNTNWKDAADEAENLGDPVLKSDMPLWWKILNLDASNFEYSRYLKRFRIKDETILRKLSPNSYQVCAGEVKEYQSYVDINGNPLKLKKKIGSIPMLDYMMKPELHNNAREQDKYFNLHPEFKNK